MPRQADRYVAITRARDGWYCELIGEEGESKHDVERRALEQLRRESPDPEEAARNLLVTAYSTALRMYYAEVRRYEAAREWSARRHGGGEET